MSHLRNLLISTAAILACACAGAALDTVAAQAAGTIHAAEPIARLATRSGAKAGRRSHSACGASGAPHRGRKHSSRKVSKRKSNSLKDSTTACRSHEARAHSTARTHERRRQHAVAPKARSPSTPAGPSLASTIASVLATPCENTELRPESGNLQAIDAATLCLVNQERARNGELSLTANARLKRAAQEHSEEMVSDDYFAHVSPSGLTPVERVRATGYIPGPEVGYTLGENIAWGTLQTEHAQRDCRRLDRLARAPREHPVRPVSRHRYRRRGRRARLARRRSARGRVLAGVRRDRRMSGAGGWVARLRGCGRWTAWTRI